MTYDQLHNKPAPTSITITINRMQAYFDSVCTELCRNCFHETYSSLHKHCESCCRHWPESARRDAPEFMALVNAHADKAEKKAQKK